MKTATVRGWGFIVVDPWDNFYHDTLAGGRRGAMDAACKIPIDPTTWRQLYREGYRCVRVPLVAKVRR